MLFTRIPYNSICHFLVWLSLAYSVDEKEIKELLDKLLDRDKYEPNSMPIQNDTRSLEGKIGIFINDMVPREQLDNHLSLDFFLTVKWKDFRLKYDMHGNISALPFDYRILSQIWVPNLYFLEVVGGSVNNIPQPNVMVTLAKDGTVTISYKIMLIFHCLMDLKYYPFDIQTCTLTLEPYSYGEDFFNLTWAGSNIDDINITTEDFSSIEIEKSEDAKFYSSFGNWKALVLKFKLHRNAPLYLIRDFLPCTLIVMLSWINFWINYRSTPARTALGITTVLTIVTMTNNVRNNSPNSPSLFRSIDIYLLTCNMFVLCALAEGALIGSTAPNEKQVKNIFQTSVKKIIQANRTKAALDTLYNIATAAKEDTTSIENTVASGNAEAKTSQRQPGDKEKKTAEKIRTTIIQRVRPHTTETFKRGPFYFYKGEIHIVDKFSRFCFPLAFLLFNCIFFISLHFSEGTVL